MPMSPPQPPVLSYSKRGRFAGLFESRGRQMIILLNGVVFALMVLVLWHAGYYEPFFGFDAGQAFVQLGCGLLGFVLAVLMMAWIIVGVAKAYLPKPWLLLGIWMGLQMVLLLIAIVGYLGDLAR